MKILAKFNDELHQLLSFNDELETPRQNRHQVPTTGLVHTLQQHSQDLYSGLLSRWKCKCTAPRVSRLLLEMHNEADEIAIILHLLLEAAGGSKQVEV